MKILIPLDGSEQANRAVQYVLGQMSAWVEPPQICLLNVQWKVGNSNVKLFIDPQTVQDYYRELGLQALDAGRQMLVAAGLPYEYHVSVGTPAEGIVQYAAEHGVAQIVMTQGGESSLQAWLLGSVTSRVLSLADCPVLVVK